MRTNGYQVPNFLTKECATVILISRPTAKFYLPTYLLLMFRWTWSNELHILWRGK